MDYFNVCPFDYTTIVACLCYFDCMHCLLFTGAACQQETLTPLENLSCPIRDLQSFFYLDQ